MARTKKRPTVGNGSQTSQDSIETGNVKKSMKHTNVDKKKKRKYRYRPGRIALQEIRKLQATTEFLIPASPFQRVVRHIVSEMLPDAVMLRFQSAALTCLQTALESYLVGLFMDSNLMTIHAKRKTLFPSDLLLVRRIRGDVVTFIN